MASDNEINTKKRNFDQEAAKWDQVPERVKVARDIAHSVIQEIILTPDMDVLDFGCGTGLLTFALQPFVRSITGVAAIILGIIAFVFVVTSLIGFCPLYLPFKISTTGKSK